ncbi:putative Hsp70 family chaperone [Rosellinia necatrix]|uniref:Putative Hsp70 family chaperone n=1 Tax=Rosellinia necatrix TaxID=77044 RepID=A0A1S8AAG3_ROSNE|nr:putative Hsp70 family chaperone [Rosellinia necatrix]
MPRSSYLSPGSSSLFEATSTNSAQTSTARTSTSMGDSTIVVGIDFGTTHSGVCWALNEGQKKLRVIMDWPNPQAANANAEKVPSTISYQDGIVHSWGYEVDIRAESFKWIKILLEPEKKYSQTVAEVRNSNNLLTKLGKTADEVVTDYLRQLWEYTREDIRKRIDEEHWEDMFKVHAVLTVPAMWSHKAKDRTLAAARRAGFPEYIEIVTEPEAAALATLKGKEQENTLKPGDAFVVCDAGGGTVVSILTENPIVYYSPLLGSYKL